jgi:hypothetical protein
MSTDSRSLRWAASVGNNHAMSVGEQIARYHVPDPRSTAFVLLPLDVN